MARIVNVKKRADVLTFRPSSLRPSGLPHSVSPLISHINLLLLDSSLHQRIEDSEPAIPFVLVATSELM